MDLLIKITNDNGLKMSDAMRFVRLVRLTKDAIIETSTFDKPVMLPKRVIDFLREAFSSPGTKAKDDDIVGLWTLLGDFAWSTEMAFPASEDDIKLFRACGLKNKIGVISPHLQCILFKILIMDNQAIATSTLPCANALFQVV